MSENIEMSYTRIEYDCSTGIQTTIDLTAEEIEQVKADQAASELRAAAEEAAAIKTADDVAAGKAKLKELGLTDDLIAALVG